MVQFFRRGRVGLKNLSESYSVALQVSLNDHPILVQHDGFIEAEEILSSVQLNQVGADESVAGRGIRLMQSADPEGS